MSFQNSEPDFPLCVSPPCGGGTGGGTVSGGISGSAGNAGANGDADPCLCSDNLCQCDPCQCNPDSDECLEPNAEDNTNCMFCNEIRISQEGVKDSDLMYYHLNIEHLQIENEFCYTYQMQNTVDTVHEIGMKSFVVYAYDDIQLAVVDWEAGGTKVIVHWKIPTHAGLTCEFDLCVLHRNPDSYLAVCGGSCHCEHKAYLE